MFNKIAFILIILYPSITLASTESVDHISTPEGIVTYQDTVDSMYLKLGKKKPIYNATMADRSGHRMPSTTYIYTIHGINYRIVTLNSRILSIDKELPIQIQDDTKEH